MESGVAQGFTPHEQKNSFSLGAESVAVALKTGLNLNAVALSHSASEIHQIRYGRLRVHRMAQVPYRLSRFFDGAFDFRTRLIDQFRSLSGVRALKASDGFQQRRNPDAPLNDGVVHLPGNARALTKQQCEARLSAAIVQAHKQ